jgi:hypothetical protein
MARSSPRKTRPRRPSFGPSMRTDSAFPRGHLSAGFSTTMGWGRSTSSPTPSHRSRSSPSVQGVLGHSCPLQSLAGVVPPKGVSFEGVTQRVKWRRLLAPLGGEVPGGHPKGQQQAMGGGVVLSGEPRPKSSTPHQLSPDPQRQVGEDALQG